MTHVVETERLARVERAFGRVDPLLQPRRLLPERAQRLAGGRELGLGPGERVGEPALDLLGLGAQPAGLLLIGLGLGQLRLQAGDLLPSLGQVAARRLQPLPGLAQPAIELGLVLVGRGQVAARFLPGGRRLGEPLLDREQLLLALAEVLLGGGQPELRQGFTTDNGNLVLDVRGMTLLDPPKIESELNQLAGVVTNGIFARRPADVLLLAESTGVRTIQPR